MTKPRVFIGSSSRSVRIARIRQKGLVARGCGYVEVWNQGIFGLNRGFLETLLVDCPGDTYSDACASKRSDW